MCKLEPPQARAAHKQRTWRRFPAWARARGVQVGDTLGMEVLGGDPCRVRFHVRPAHTLCFPMWVAATTHEPAMEPLHSSCSVFLAFAL